MKIAVCEDNKAEREKLVEHLEKSLSSRKIEASVFAFSSGEELIESAKRHYFSVLFLDIFLPGISGIEIARQMRRQNNTCAVAFTTITADYLAESYDIWAVHYILKPLKYSEVDEALFRAMQLVFRRERTLEITLQRHREYIPYSDIVYIEGQGRKCLVHTRTGDHLPYISIQELMGKLKDKRFANCHRSYIVNLDHALGIQKGRFIMRGEFLIPIRRGDVSAMLRQYEDRRFSLVGGSDEFV
ncbi:LytTR family DNA-binding domain-containing protein [Clostridiaceae bacterium OttesenSCG-928-D20]|nr:LytTR family DNA-binding domain-containing protein [Clostridiaceae bacterium OttesenSCG-928-D20]